MFEFLSQHAKVHADPLQSRRTASAWFSQLPALDVLGRQQQVVHALETLRRARIDRDRISAIAYVDSAFESEQRKLIQWHLDNLSASPRVAARFRDAATEVNQAFLEAYRVAVDPVCANADNWRWKPLVPVLLARLVRRYGIDAKLGLLRGDGWGPAKWRDLHHVFLRAAELGVERVPATSDRADEFGDLRTVEQEYVYVLLIHQLDTGNLTPAELEWASSKLHGWSRDLSLNGIAPPSGGFYVDLSGANGLVRRTGSDHGVRVGYVDTTLLAQHLDATIAGLDDPQARPEAASMRQRDLAVLEKLRPALAPHRPADLRRHPRTQVDIAAAVHVGLAGISLHLGSVTGGNGKTSAGKRASQQILTVGEGAALPASSARENQRAKPYYASTTHARFEALRFDDEDAAYLMAQSRVEARRADASRADDNTFMLRDDNAAETAPDLADEEANERVDIELMPIAESRRGIEGRAEHRQSPSEAPMLAGNPMWRLKDRSVTGWRVCATGNAGQTLDVDALIALRPFDVGDWMLGVVRRIHKRPNDQIEAGVSLIGDRVFVVALHATRQSREEISVVVDGVDVATIGPRFVGLYLLPSPRHVTRVSLRTLVIPTPEYAEGRRLMLATGPSTYTIVLRHLIDRHPGWSWATMQIAERLPHVA